jgi:hypothetical protein
MAPQDFAAAAVDRQFVIGKVFIADLDFQPGGKIFQILEEGRVGPFFNHENPLASMQGHYKKFGRENQRSQFKAV